MHLRWPAGWTPLDVRAHPWPLWLPPRLELPDAVAVDAHGGVTLTVHETRRSAVLICRRPLPGIKRALSWALP